MYQMLLFLHLHVVIEVRVTFQDAVLVDHNVSGPAAMDVNPPEAFYRLGAVDTRDAQTRIYGPGHTPGPQHFDFSTDSGRSWSADGVALTQPIHTTYSLPLHKGTSRRYSHSEPSPSDFVSFTSDGWTELGASTFSLTSGGKLQGVLDRNATWTWSGIPAPGMNATAGKVFNSPRVYPIVELPGGGWVAGVCIVWNGIEPHRSPDGPFPPLSIVAFRSDDGFNWKYTSTIHNISQAPWSTFGPNEHDMAVLADGKSIMAVIRPDGDAGCSSGTYRNYYQSYSTDSGDSWSLPRPIHGAGCARPRLLKIEPKGPLLMSGGRLCVENTTGIFLWVNSDALAGLHGGNDTDIWQRYSIPQKHNELWTGPEFYKFDASVYDPNAFATLAYTSLIQTGPKSAAVLYNKFFSPYKWPPWPNANFIMHFTFV